MTTAVTVDQLRNLTDRAATGLTADEQARLRDGINQLEALQQIARGYCPDCGRGDATPTVDDWQTERQRANQAEAALARLQAIADEHPAGIDTALILAELPDRPAGGTPPVHVGGRVNAEDCPACTAAVVPPPYPWICPGPG